jgi:sucrose phosphorylase
MLSLRGIPGVYLHSLLATPNDTEAVELTGINRRINRRKWSAEELQEHLSEELPQFVFETYLQMLRRRSAQPAFHPDASQQVFEIDPQIFAHNRVSLNSEQIIVCIYNFSAENKSLGKDSIRSLSLSKGNYHDILSGHSHSIQSSEPFVLQPYQAVWLVQR